MKKYQEYYDRIVNADWSDSTLSMIRWWKTWIETCKTVSEQAKETVELLNTMKWIAETLESWEASIR